jgi:hypothetical protein
VDDIRGKNVRVLTPVAAHAVRGTSCARRCGRFGRIVGLVPSDHALWERQGRYIVAYR